MTASLTDLFRTIVRSLVGAGSVPRRERDQLPAALSLIGKVVPNLGKPDEVARGVLRLDRDLDPVLSGTVVMLPLDGAGRSHRLSHLDWLGEFGVDESNGSAVLSDNSPGTGDYGSERRHRHHSMPDRLGNAEHFGARSPFLVRMNGIHVERGQRVMIDRRLGVRLYDRRKLETGFNVLKRD